MSDSHSVIRLESLEPRQAAMYQIAMREAERYLAHSGLMLANGGQADRWFEVIPEMINAYRADREHAVTVEVEQERADKIDAFLSAHQEEAKAAGIEDNDQYSASSLAVSLGNDSADAGFVLGVAVALRFMGGVR